VVRSVCSCAFLFPESSLHRLQKVLGSAWLEIDAMSNNGSRSNIHGSVRSPATLRDTTPGNASSSAPKKFRPVFSFTAGPNDNLFSPGTPANGNRQQQPQQSQPFGFSFNDAENKITHATEEAMEAMRHFMDAESWLYRFQHFQVRTDNDANIIND
jgi:hypothetical protein